MPIQQCQIDGKQGWRFGASGKCYTGPSGKARARRQERAIRASGFTENARSLNPLRLDPTRTSTLRRKFEEELAHRFARLKRAIRDLVVVEDAFGLRRFRGFVLQERNDENRQIGLGSVDSDGSANNNRIIAGANHNSIDPDSRLNTLNQRWAFQTDPAKVQQFKQWLKTRVESDMFMAASGQVEEGYWETFVREGYRKGAGRAFDDVNRGKRAIAATEEDFAFFQGSKEQFLQESFAQPVAIDKVKLLAERTLTDLQGVGQSLATSLTRELAEGLVQGMNPREIARRMSRNLDIGKRRAQQIARTEIIRAHAEGALDSLERLGVDRVGVMVEWSTAGDDRVCPLCEELEGVVLRISEARGLIPRHTQCRCAHIPANVGESTTKQKRTKQEIQSAIDDSVRAELPKGRDIKGVGRRFQSPETGRFTSKTKRTLAEQKKRTRWVGADKRIAKKRPRSVVELPTKVKPKPPSIRKPVSKPETRAKPPAKKKAAHKIPELGQKKVDVMHQGNPRTKQFGGMSPETRKWVNGLSSKKHEAIVTYADNFKTVSGLDSAIAGAPKNEGTFYRGMAFKRFEGGALAQGKEITFGRVASVSRNRHVAESFMSDPTRSKQLHLFKINGKSARDIRGISSYLNQEEFVFEAKAKFRVTKTSSWTNPRGRKIQIVELDEL